MSTNGHSRCVLQYVQSGSGRSHASWAFANLDGHAASPAVRVPQQPIHHGHQLRDRDWYRQSNSTARLWRSKGCSSIGSCRWAIPLLLATLLHFPPLLCTGCLSSSHTGLTGGGGHLDWLLLLHLQPLLLRLSEQTDQGGAGKAPALSVSPSRS